MKNLTKVLLIITLITPIVMSIDCTKASSTLCQAQGGQCAYFTFINGTCTAPTSCPVNGQIITVWSNATYNCVPCSGASKSICESSCAQYNFYFDNNSRINTCTTCKAEYGTFCTSCNSLECQSCSNGTKLSSDKQSCVDSICGISYCVTCVDGKCTVCDQSHLLYNGICACSIVNCQICGNSICYKCQKGFYLDSSKLKCNVKCIDNCLECTTTTYCTTCFDGYYYNIRTNQCTPNCALIDSNCVSCSTINICQGCKTNYSLSANGKSCKPVCVDSNCITCTNQSICESCSAGYKLNSTTCVRDICKIINCRICDTSSNCSTCQQFHILSTDKRRCQANCSAQCRFCQTNTSCSACIDGYNLISGACSPSCSISNCNLCASASTCFSCKFGYVLTQNNQQCDYDCGIYKCIYCNSTTTCQACYPGFDNINGTVCSVNCQEGLFRNSTSKNCQHCPQNCASCNSQKVCLSCKYLFYLNSSSLICQACTKIANCFSCTSETNCQICIKGYSLINSACKQISSSCSVADCIVCSNSTTCDLCKQKYELTNSSTACSRIVCSSVGQYLVGSTCTCGPKSFVLNGQCTSCSDRNCLSCTSSVCMTCASGYYAVGTSCYTCNTGCQTCDASSCSSCKSGFVKNGKTCIQSSNSRRRSSFSRRGNKINCAAGCKTCDIDNSQNLVCLQADTGYVLVAGNIFKCGGSCLTCSNTASNGSYSICLTCPSRYNLISGTCTQCTDQNALTCSISNSSYALTCLPGYNAENGECKACSSNCLKCGKQSGKCDVGGCNFGFFQSKGLYQCIKCFNGCPLCDSDPNQCLYCGNYKYLEKTLCYSCPSNCLKCTNSTVCSTCVSGYGLAEDKSCKILNIAGCTEYNSNITCAVCDQYYTFTSGSCILNMTCNSSSSCTTCSYNFYLSNGSCLQCPTLSNCYSCDTLNSSNCIECASGYYLSTSKTCIVCPSNCSTCSSENVCTGAKDGYYLVFDITGTATGKTNSCGGLCETCIDDALICLSCKSGAQFAGSQCISKRNYQVKYVGYAKVLGKNSAQSQNYQVGFVVGFLSNFLSQVAKALKFSTLAIFIQNSNVESVKYQSVAVSFSTNADTVSSDPTVTLKNTQFTDMTLISLSVVNNTTPESNVNLGLVLGVSIPLALLLIVILIVLKSKSAKEDNEEKVGESEKNLQNEGSAI